MPPSQSSHADLLHRLQRAQRRNRRRLSKVEAATAVVVRLTGKLAKNEARIAKIETLLATSTAESSPEQSAPEEPAVSPDVLLIFNPSAGGAKQDNAARLAEVLRALGAHGIRPRIEIKTSGKAARAFTREQVKTGGGMVIVAAGDGTLGDVATELIGTQTVLGVIPIGTMNNLARSLGIPLDIDAACALLAMRTTRRIDAGRVRVGVRDTPDSPMETVNHFFDCAGVGKLAAAALTGQALVKRQWRALPRGIRALFGATRAPLQVDVDGQVIVVSTSMVTISNAPIMGNKLLCAPGARMDDGLLDVSVYAGLGDVALAEHFLAISDGRTDPITTYTGRTIRITASEALPVTSDMRVTAKRHVIEISVIPGAVEMVVGNGIALALPVESGPLAPTFAPDPPLLAPESAANPTDRLEDGLANGARASRRRAPGRGGALAEGPG